MLDDLMGKLISRFIHILSWVGGGLVMIDRNFHAPISPFWANFHWLGKWGANLVVLALLLLEIRILFLKPSGERNLTSTP